MKCFILIIFFVLSLITSLNFYSQTLLPSSGTQIDNGSGSWRVPVGVTSITIQAWGGGGAGAGTTVNNATGRAGGAGGSFVSTTISVTPGQIIWYSVAATRSGATTDVADGNDTWVNKSTNAAPSSSSNGVLAKGGKSASGTSGGDNVTAAQTTLCVGTTIYRGGNSSTAGANATGGGAGAGTSQNGANNSGSTGGSGAGGGGSGGNGSGTGGGAGVVGTAPGGGGGGAYVNNNSDRSGGSGAAGRIILTYTNNSGNNNLCANATSLPCGTSNLNGTTLGTSSQTPGIGCTISGNGVWYTFVGNGQETTISTTATSGLTSGSTFDHEMAIAYGSCGSFTNIVCKDNDFGNGTETHTFVTTVGVNYYVYVAYYTTGSTTGNFTISRTCTPICEIPTNGGTLSSTKTNTTVNDATTLTTTGNDGTITLLEWSFNNFTSVAGSESNPPNPYSIIMNVQQSQIYFRTTSKDGTCPSGNSNIVTINLNNATPYVPVSGSTYGVQLGDYISNVTLGNINNTSTNDGDAYENFKSQIIELTKGEPYSLSVTATRTANPGQGYSAWIDWNGDGVFQTTENVMQKSPANSASQLINVPSDAFTGDVLMRVLSVWNTTPSTDAYSTTTYRWGEIEEYTVRLSNPISLPVELTQFESFGYPQWNVIKWTTASENNSSHFDLESSSDGENWRKITTKPSAGNSTEEIKYSYIDYNLNSLTYYRLQQFDIDGAFKTYGPILVIKTITDKKIVKYINLIGQEVNPDYTRGLIIEIYDDGSIRKMIR